MNCIHLNTFIQEGEGVSSCLSCDIANEPPQPIHFLKASELEQRAILLLEDGESWPIVANGIRGKIERKDGRHILSLEGEVVYEASIYNHGDFCAYVEPFSLTRKYSKELRKLMKSY